MRESTFALRRLSTIERTVGVLHAAQVADDVGGRDLGEVAADAQHERRVATAPPARGRRARYSSAKPAIEMKNATPSSVKRMANRRLAITDLPCFCLIVGRGFNRASRCIICKG